MNKILVIFQKEILDNMRDYRSWMTGLFWALFGPLILGGMIMLLGSSIRENVDESLVLPVMGAENAPNLIAFLEQQDVIINPAPADLQAAILAGDINVALIIPPDYGEDFSAGKLPKCNSSLIARASLQWWILIALKIYLKDMVITSDCCG